MTRHDDTVRLRHMLSHAREAIQMTQGRSRQDLDSDRMLELSLVRLVEVIGEAAAQVSQQGRSHYTTIPWQEATGMRNRLIHGYDKIDRDILWDTIKIDLPPLVSELDRILLQMDPSAPA
jgi:uncharacterized protein with HEPN domain